MQKFSLFHDADEKVLKTWHAPYANLFGPNDNVLDIGCGLGYFADLVEARKASYLGVDLDAAMVQATRARGHNAIQADVTTLSAEGQRYSGIHISHLIEHLWGEQVVRLFETCAKLLDVNGVVIVRTPNWTIAEVRHRTFWLDHTHRRPYPPELICKLFRDLGLAISEAGSEPYGVADTYVIASHPLSTSHARKLHFGANPFTAPSGVREEKSSPDKSLLRRLAGKLRRKLMD